MVLRFYPKKDATIYEEDPFKNTGMDAILDISKVLITSPTFESASYASRILLDFDYPNISSSIVALGYNPNLFTYNLKLRSTQGVEIPADYTVYCYPVSGAWDMGIGRNINVPDTTQGVSWTYRLGKLDPSTAWRTSSYAAGSTGSYAMSSSAGGGTWYTSSVVSQSFSYTTSNLNLNVTSIINQVQSSSIVFTGFILKKSDSDELSHSISSNSLMFFSKETGTVYLPTLEASYADNTSAGSLETIDNTTRDINPVVVNLQPSYVENTRPKIRVSARYTYPTITFSTSSAYLDRYRFPSGSQYAIYDAHTDDAIIEFSNYTLLSDDATSNYINLHLDSFQPQRYYRLVLKIPMSGSLVDYQIYDNKWTFKVARS